MTLSNGWITLSSPEIKTLATNAARGGGFSWGMAEECGRATLWLAQRGFDWSETLTTCLSAKANTKIKPAVKKWHTEELGCPIHAGATLTDFIGLPEGFSGAPLEIGRLRCPLLFLPFAVHAAAALGKQSIMLLDREPWFYLDGCSVFQLTHRSLGEDASVVSLQSIENDGLVTKERPVKNISKHMPIKRRYFEELEAMARRITVPSTALSETRAGGEKADND